MATPDLPMTLKVYDASGNFLNEFPNFTNLQVLDCINDVPAFTLSYNLNAPNASNFISDSDIQVAVLMDFRDGNGFTEVSRYLYEQDTYDPSMSESAIIQANGRGIVALLEQGLVYPQGGVGNPNTNWSFTGASPGKIMNDFINAAKARGCFPSLTTSFTSGADSSGNAWTQAFTNAYTAGTSILDVLLGLSQAALCDFNMSGTTLNIYNADTTLATDRSSSVILRRGRDIVSLPYQRDRTQIGTVMLAIGDNGVNVERTAATLGTVGRREKYMAQSGVTNVGTLEFWADVALGSIDDQQTSITPSYLVNIDAGTPVPWKHYKPGDYIGIDIGGTSVKYRSRQWAVQCTAGGPTTIQPTLNDIFFDRNSIQEGKIHALSGGSVTGVTQITNLPGPNATIPNPPAFIPSQIYTGAYYSPATGTTLAQLELAWTTPTNTDNTPVNDGQDFLIQYRISANPIYPLAWSQLQGKPWSSINGNPWTNALATPQNQQWTTMQVPFDQNNAIVSGLICGETYEFQIATTDVSGNTSLFSAISSFTTATDNVAPSQPDAPQVAASMVAVQVTHDLGRASGGTYNLEQDLDHLEVHYSYDPSFTPIPGVTSNTYLGKLIANAGMMAAGIAPVGTFSVTSTTGIYIKIIAVDRSGNSSPPSPSAGVTVTLIDDTHISSMNVSKLLAGTVMATIVIGGSFTTGLSGRRVTMDSTGVHAYDALGNVSFDLNAGTPIITLGSSSTGAKITLDTSLGYPVMQFYDDSATNFASLLAFQDGVGSGSNSAGIQLYSGTYTITSGPDTGTFYGLLSMQGHDSGINVSVRDNATKGSNGGSLELTVGSASLGVFREASTHGGQIIFIYDSTSTDTQWEIDGFVFSASGAFPQQTNYVTQWLGGPGDGALAAGYGSTMYSNTIVLCQLNCPTTTTIPAWTVSAVTTTGFTATFSAAMPGAYHVYSDTFRVR